MDGIRSYLFGSITEGNASMKDVLGGKGANLAEMSSLGIPVPPGFTIPCGVCTMYKELGNSIEFTSALAKVVDAGVQYLHDHFGYTPLLSVRSGARVSMPGMMDTILNVGITPDNLPDWIERIGERAALDSYRRLIQMLGSVAMGIPMHLFEDELTTLKSSVGVAGDADLTAAHLSRLINRYLSVVASQGKVFPTTLGAQLEMAVTAVFVSWDNPRAEEYRKINNIPYEWGTAVTVQAMVFGNMNDNSCTGVLFSRNPSTGDSGITGEFLVNAQGEDVVAGIRTPEPISAMAAWNHSVYHDLKGIVYKLEEHYADMQDIEFTVQDGVLYLLQTRNGKRSARAAFKVAHDLMQAGYITLETARSRVTKDQLLVLMKDSVDPSFKKAPQLTGIAAGGGIVSGVAVFSAKAAINCKEPCILVTKETDPDDLAGMNASVGILTATGGLTSHAAVVARGMDKTCVVGATDLSFSAGIVSAYVKSEKAFDEGDLITIDGSTGNVWVKMKVPTIQGGVTPEAHALLAGCIEGAERLDVDPSNVKASLSSVVKPTVYVDAALLRGEEGSISWLADMWTHLPAHVVEAVIDLRVSEMASDNDKVMSFMFGLSDAHAGSMEIELVNILLEWSTVNASKSTLLLSDAVPSTLRESLKSLGFSIYGAVNTFADLLASNGPVTASDSVVKKVFGGKAAFKKALSLLCLKEGSSTAPPYWYEDILKGGS